MIISYISTQSTTLAFICYCKRYNKRNVRSPLLSILLAVLTVSPNRQYLQYNILLPGSTSFLLSIEILCFIIFIHYSTPYPIDNSSPRHSLSNHSSHTTSSMQSDSQHQLIFWSMRNSEVTAKGKRLSAVHWH